MSAAAAVDAKGDRLAGALKAEAEMRKRYMPPIRRVERRQADRLPGDELKQTTASSSSLRNTFSPPTLTWCVSLRL